MVDVLSLGPNDVYVYAHGNGALYVEFADGRSIQAPLPEVRAAVLRQTEAGGRVHVGGDRAPSAVAALEDLGTLGVLLEPFTPAQPPLTWKGGTTALMSAAASGADHLLADLIARGIPVREVDDRGWTALHHAARAGNLPAVEALVAEGASAGARSADGQTPGVVAAAAGHRVVADHLRRLAPEAAEPGTTRTFSLIHLVLVSIWWFVPVVLLTIVATAAAFGVIAVLAAVVLSGVVLALLVPRLESWVGCAPRRLDGTILTLRRPTGTRLQVDLAAAGPIAALSLGRSTTRARQDPHLLLIAHPEGQLLDGKALLGRGIPTDEIDLVLSKADRFVAVAIDGKKLSDVLPPIIDLLLGQGVALAPNLDGADLRPRSTWWHRRRARRR